jgi:hypothetical protein
MSRRFAPSLKVELVVYLVVGLIGIGPALQSGHVPGDGVDMYGTLWFFWWIQDCLLNLRNPGFTELFFYPMGKDIFAHTGNNFVDAYAAAPFYWVFGNPGYYRWFVLAVLLANALTFRSLAKVLFKSPWAVFGATLAWLVNPYVLFEITCGRVTQGFLPFLPLAIKHFLQMEAHPSSWKDWRHPVLAGLFTAAQAWTYWFMGYFMAFVFVWLAVVGLKRSKNRARLLGAYAVAALSCVAAISPAAISMASAAADGAVPGLSDGVTKSVFSLPQEVGNNVASNLHGYLFAEFLATPLFVGMIWTPTLLIWWARGDDRVRWVPPFFLVLILSLGPTLADPQPGGDTYMVMPWYMALYHYAPFFDRLWFPYRMVVMCFLLASIGVGGVIERLEREPLRFKGVPVAPRLLLIGVVLFVGLGTLLEQARYRVYPFITRDVSMPKTFEVVRDEGGYLLHLPWGVSQPAIIWQTYHHQPIFGGMGENAPILRPDGFGKRIGQPFTRALIDCAKDPDRARKKWEPVHRTAFQDEGFRWVVLHRDLIEFRARSEGTNSKRAEQIAFTVTRELIEELGPPTMVEGAFVTWDLHGTSTPPSGTAPNDYKLWTKVWETHEIPAYELALKEQGRLPITPGDPEWLQQINRERKAQEDPAGSPAPRAPGGPPPGPGERR